MLQTIATAVLGVLAAAYLVRRWARKRASGSCCGEAECPAMKQAVDRMLRGGS